MLQRYNVAKIKHNKQIEKYSYHMRGQWGEHEEGRICEWNAIKENAAQNEDKQVKKKKQERIMNTRRWHDLFIHDDSVSEPLLITCHSKINSSGDLFGTLFGRHKETMLFEKA